MAREKEPVDLQNHGINMGDRTLTYMTNAIFFDLGGESGVIDTTRLGQYGIEESDLDQMACQRDGEILNMGDRSQFRVICGSCPLNEFCYAGDVMRDEAPWR